MSAHPYLVTACLRYLPLKYQLTHLPLNLHQAHIHWFYYSQLSFDLNIVVFLFSQLVIGSRLGLSEFWLNTFTCTCTLSLIIAKGVFFWIFSVLKFFVFSVFSQLANFPSRLSLYRRFLSFQFRLLSKSPSLEAMINLKLAFVMF